MSVEAVLSCCCTQTVSCCPFTTVQGNFQSMQPLSVNGLDMGDGTFLQTGRLNQFTQAVVSGPIQLFPTLFLSVSMTRSNAPQGRCGYRQQYSGPNNAGWFAVGTNFPGFMFRIRASDNLILQSYGGNASPNGFGGFQIRRWVTPFSFSGGTWHYEIGMEAGGLAVGAIAPYPAQGCPVSLVYTEGNSSSSNAYRGTVRPLGGNNISWGEMAISPTTEWFRPWPSVAFTASVT